MQPPLDEQQRLSNDTGCLACGYNLRGLGLESSCPECGLSVSKSARDGLLTRAPAPWIADVRRGALVLLLAPFALVAGTVLALAVVFGGRLFADPQTPFWVGMLFALPAGVMWVIGLVLLTRSEPGRSSGPIKRWIRRLLWVAVGLGVAAALAQGFSALPQRPGWPVFALVLVQDVLGAAISVLMLLYLSILARRVWRVGLAKQLCWAAVACASLSFLSIVITIAQRAQPQPTAPAAASGPTAQSLAAAPASPVSPAAHQLNRSATDMDDYELIRHGDHTTLRRKTPAAGPQPPAPPGGVATPPKPVAAPPAPPITLHSPGRRTMGSGQHVSIRPASGGSPVLAVAAALLSMASVAVWVWVWVLILLIYRRLGRAGRPAASVRA